MREILKKIIFFIKRILFYLFIIIILFSVLYLLIDIIFCEPDITSINDYINWYMIIFYFIIMLLLMYVINYLKKNRFHVIEKCISFVVILCLVLPTIFNIALDKYEKVEEIKQGKVVINNYLYPYFDEDEYEVFYTYHRKPLFASSGYCYKIINDSLDLSFSVELSAVDLSFNSITLINSFLERYIVDNGNALDNYLNSLGVLPYNVYTNVSFKEINFRNLKNDLSLFNVIKNSTYEFSSFTVYLDEVDKDKIVKLSSDLLKVYREYIYPDKTNSINMWFYVNNKEGFYGRGIVNKQVDGSLLLKFWSINDGHLELLFEENIK